MRGHASFSLPDGLNHARLNRRRIPRCLRLRCNLGSAAPAGAYVKPNQESALLRVLRWHGLSTKGHRPGCGRTIASLFGM